MKYIRTKDGRIIYLNRTVHGNKLIHLDENVIEGGNWSGWYWKTDEYGYEIECRDVDIIKTANTIEELCDEAVFFDDKNKPHYKSQEGNIWYLGAGLYTETLRFGIWTDKGLIYVAKMNQEGELELL